MSRFARPENMLKRSEELVGVGQSAAALQALNDVFGSRRFKSTPLTSLEPILMRFVELCVELRRGRTAKDGLNQYRNVAQNTNPASVELVIRHFIKLAEQKVVEAQEKADAAAEQLDKVDDLEESETPESMLLGAVTSEESRDRTDRTLVTPWLKFLWEAYRTALDILRNNARLEVPYQQIAHQALKFCLQYQRKTEFRRLCDLLRTHLQNVARSSHHTYAINLAEPDTLQRHLDTRFAQLNSAVELELWQEAFRSVEDIHNLLTMAKKAPKPSMMANYYEKLSRIFLVSDNSLFHAAAWNRYYLLARPSVKSDEEHTRMASFVLLSALSVPVISTSAPGTGNLNKSKSDFLLGDQETRSRTGRLTSLLGLSRSPTRAGLLREALQRNVLKRVRPELRELYEILEAEFHPLSICDKIQPIMEQLAQDADMAKYVKPLHSVILTRLFQQLSQVYDSVRLERVMELVSPFKAPYAYTAADIERFCLNACKKGHLSIKLDHVSRAITFQDDVFSAEVHPAAGASALGESTDAVRLQATPGELVRSQLARLATALDATLQTIDPSGLEEAERAKRAAFARAVEVAEQEHKAAITRKAILARRRELLEERAARRQRDEAQAKAERERAVALAEQARQAEEARRREQERIRKEMEAVRLEETRKMAQNLVEKGGLKLTEEEFANLDTEKLVQMQVEQIEKEKRDLAERLRIVYRRMDHLERAYRREELPLLEKDYERQKDEDRVSHGEAREALLVASREKHAADLELKKRLQRILPDYTELRTVIEGKRRVELEERRRRAHEQIEAEKQKRRAQVARERLERKLREEEERKRREEEARLAEIREQEEERRREEQRLEEERQKELEAEKRKEIEARQARLAEVAEKQRQREREIEERMERERAERRAALGAATASAGAAATAATASPADVPSGEWRRAPPAGAVAEAKAEITTNGPPKIAGLKPGGWREREATRTTAPPGPAAPSAAASPVPTPAARASGSPAPRSYEANGTASPGRGAPPPREAESTTAGDAPSRPSLFARSAASGGGWRARQAAKEAAGGAGGGASGGASGASTPSAAAAAAPAPAAKEATRTDDDGFTEVRRTTSAYKPPALRK